MIDIHSHILPGLDDGAKSAEETLGIVRQLYEAGFRKIFATPHVLEGREYLCPEEILTATDQVRELVAGAGIAVEILPGAENYIFPDMAKWAQAGKLMTLGNLGKYLLLELPMFEIPHYTDQVFFELQVQGLIPVLAHPERYKGLTDEPELLLEWAKKGVLFQIDLRSLNGRYGPKALKLAETFLYSNLIHFVGSDAHRVAHSESSIRESLQSVRDLVGDERYQELTMNNPLCIFNGDNIIRDEGEYLLKKIIDKRKKKRKFWSLFT